MPRCYSFTTAIITSLKLLAKKLLSLATVFRVSMGQQSSTKTKRKKEKIRYSTSPQLSDKTLYFCYIARSLQNVTSSKQLGILAAALCNIIEKNFLQHLFKGNPFNGIQTFLAQMCISIYARYMDIHKASESCAF